MYCSGARWGARSSQLGAVLTDRARAGPLSCLSLFARAGVGFVLVLVEVGPSEV